MSDAAPTPTDTIEPDRDDFDSSNRYRAALARARVCRRFGLRDVEDIDDEPEDGASHVDAVALETVRSTSGSVVLSKGARIDVKSCHVTLESGRAGRIKIKQGNHNDLVDDDGYYAVVVVDDDDEVRRCGLIRARAVDGMIDSWWDAGHSKRDDTPYRQLPWTKFFGELDTEPTTLEDDLLQTTILLEGEAP